jgi:glycosyltransferase involved in cell wall biosynthesis
MMSFDVPRDPARWPFLFVLDAAGRHTGWALVNGPVVTRGQHDQFAALRRGGFRFIGMSSYLDFPRGCRDGALDYEIACDAWCHCFRDPDRFLRTPLPRALISVSDFTDYQQVAPERVDLPPPGGRYDVVYVGAVEPWKREAKNWRLAAAAIPRLCDELDLTALVVGVPTPDFPASTRVTFRWPVPWASLLAAVATARFLLVPNITDASPRVLAEALCLDTPVLVHRDILGGWKYVNRFTGAFFADEQEVVPAARATEDGGLAPRRWFRANYGPYQAGARLLALVRTLDPALAERSHLRLSEAAA